MSATNGAPGRATGSQGQRLRLYSVDLGPACPTYPFGRETFVLRDDAEQFIDDVRRDDPEVADRLVIEEWVLEGVGGLN